jgi:hypothetical protein
MFKVKETVEVTALGEYTKIQHQTLVIGGSKEKIFVKLAKEVRNSARENGFIPINIGYLAKVNDSIWIYAFCTEFEHAGCVIQIIFEATYKFTD